MGGDVHIAGQSGSVNGMQVPGWMVEMHRRMVDRIVGAGEVGELTNAVYEQDTKRITKEAGDLLWYLSEICSTFGINLDDVAQVNLDKLKARKEQGKIQGSGDDREEKA